MDKARSGIAAQVPPLAFTVEGLGYYHDFTRQSPAPDLGTRISLGPGDAFIERHDGGVMDSGEQHDVTGLKIPPDGVWVKLKPGTIVADAIIGFYNHDVTISLHRSRDLADLIDHPHARLVLRRQGHYDGVKLRTRNAEYLLFTGGGYEFFLHFIALVDA